MKYSNTSPNVKPEGKRLISTIELLQKRAALRVELANLGISIAQNRQAGYTDMVKSLLVVSATLKRRIAIVGLRLSERIIEA